MSPKTMERREHKRVAGTLRFKSADNDTFIEMQCKNVSLGGAYCISKVGFPLMTKMMIHIYLPGRDGRTALSGSPLAINAYVVRSEKIEKGPDRNHYHLAIFFKELDASQAEMLREFIKKRSNSKKPPVNYDPAR